MQRPKLESGLWTLTSRLSLSNMQTQPTLALGFLNQPTGLDARVLTHALSGHKSRAKDTRGFDYPFTPDAAPTPLASVRPAPGFLSEGWHLSPIQDPMAILDCSVRPTVGDAGPEIQDEPLTLRGLFHQWPVEQTPATNGANVC